MSKHTENVISATLKHRTLSDAAIFEVERLGDEAFDYISARMTRDDAMDKREIVNAFRLLIVLCRKFCVLRKRELVGLAILFLERDEIEVRSAAANAATAEVSMIELTPSLQRSQGIDDVLRGQLEAALRKALTMGLAPRESTIARGYLKMTG